MPYISTEEVKKFRNALKLAIPEVKFSVHREDHSVLHVHIMKSDLDLGPDHRQINPYYFKNHYADNPQLVNLIERVIAVRDSVNAPKEEVYDGDYGSVPTYYFRMHIGKWNRPYVKA